MKTEIRISESHAVSAVNHARDLKKLMKELKKQVVAYEKSLLER